MPALKSVRHETFARNIASSPKTGLSQGECYTKAGFKTNGRSADACAARLLTAANVQMRIAEIMAPALKKTRISVESLLAELETTIGDARADGHHATVVSALTLSAKLVGLLRDKIEVGGPGSFDALETPADVAGALLADMDTEEALQTIDALREAVLAAAADQARHVVSSPTSIGFSESERSLALFRSKSNGRHR